MSIPAESQISFIDSGALEEREVTDDEPVSGFFLYRLLHFASLGLGLAIVNDCCRLPSGLVGKPLKQFPDIQYHVFHLTRKAGAGPVKDLKRFLVEARL
ncbi:MAG: hypothetical protein AB7W16_11340 [Candidatus Obscuribacterales bacterium]